jgi:hypothetical protein
MVFFLARFHILALISWASVMEGFAYAPLALVAPGERIILAFLEPCAT